MDSRPEDARPYLERALAHHRLCVRANVLLGDLELGTRAARGRHRRVEAHRDPEPRLPRTGGRTADRRVQAARQGAGRPQSPARVPRQISVARRAQRGVHAAYSTSRAPSPRTGWCAMKCAAARRCWASTNCSRRNCSTRRCSAARISSSMKNLVHQHTRTLAMYQVRQLRVSRAPVLLALSGLRRVGNILAAAHEIPEERGIRREADAGRATGHVMTAGVT